MIYLHKILPLFASPLFLIILFIILGIIFKSKKIHLLALTILIFCSLPIISNKLINYLEKDYAPQDTSTADRADAIVVLSGIVKTIKADNKLKYEFSDGVDRILSGIDLFKDDKAPLLILTKGQLPWSMGISEGEYLKNFAIKFGVPEESILLTENAQNTDQEAKAVRKLFNKNKIRVILVTSAFHMPRAKKVFVASNIKVIPFAVDYKSVEQKITFMDFIPSADSLNAISFVVRELIGRLYYNLKY
jgi:uncharacterized SAM-binding protein YcdF (DUF218 family)